MSSGLDPNKPGNGRRISDANKNPTKPGVWKKLKWTDVINILIATASLAVSAASLKIASDSSDIRKAIGEISALAAQTKRQANATEGQLKTMQTSATAAQGQLTTSREQQRAWVSAISPGIEVFDTTARFTVRIDNIGIEPALNLTSFIEAFAYTPIGKALQNDINGERFEANKSCEKAADPGTGVFWPKQVPLIKVSAKKIIPINKSAMAAGDQWYGVRGCFHYTTVGKPRVTRFCYFMLSRSDAPFEKWDWTICPGKGQQYAN